jgi:hypothetical protein
MGVIEAILLEKPSWIVQWIGPKLEDEGWGNCSRNSTAVVGLHGIQAGISPLGDDLVEAFHQTKSFIEHHRPEGVRPFRRHHLCHGKESDSYEKLIQRFQTIENIHTFNCDFLGVSEDVFVFEPMTFLSWWSQRLLKSKNLTAIEDFVVEVSPEENWVKGLKGSYLFELIIDCRGSGLNNETIVNVKKTPGHYWVWDLEKSNSENFEEVVLTLNGHNLILDKSRNQAILGGSTEKNDVCAPALDQLVSQRNSFTQLIPSLKELLTSKEPRLFTGLRPKAPKRRPLIKKVSSNWVVLNGFYKNGYSLCHSYGKRLLNSL